jgi:hypothetical protein
MVVRVTDMKLARSGVGISKYYLDDVELRTDNSYKRKIEVFYIVTVYRCREWHSWLYCDSVTVSRVAQLFYIVTV